MNPIFWIAMGFSNHQSFVLTTTATCSSTLSMFGSLVVLVSYAKLPKHNRKELGQRMVMLMSVLDFFASLAFSFGEVFIPKEGKQPSGICKFQAWSIQIMVAAVVWNSVMAVNFYCLVVLRMDPRTLRIRLKYEIAAVLLFFGMLATSLFGVSGLYGNAVLWCWITSSHPAAQLGAFYSFVLLSWAICLYCLIAVGRAGSEGLKTGKSFQNRASLAARESANAVAGRLRLYLLCFLFVWFFGLLNRVIGAVTTANGTASPYATAFLQVLFVPLQGFVNMLIYHGYVDNAVTVLYPWCCTALLKLNHCFGKVDTLLFGENGNRFFKHSDSNPLIASRRKSKNSIRSSKNSQSDLNLPDAAGWYRSEFGPLANEEEAAKKGIFVTTFNLGEAELQFEDLEAWLPRGYDLYAIGVQECMILPQLKAAVLSHLNMTSYHNTVVGKDSTDIEGDTSCTYTSSDGTGYMMYTKEIGSTNTNMGFHGMIALLVLARVKEVEAGAVAVELNPVRSGVHMGLNIGGIKAPNKGGCGISLRYYDTNLAFLTSHFASDSGGKLRFHVRNEHTSLLLNGAILEASDQGVDVSLAHHHTFVFGDFNYRTADIENPEDVLDLVHEACSKEIVHKGNSWRQHAWRHLFHLAALFEAGATSEVKPAWEDHLRSTPGESNEKEADEEALLSSRQESKWGSGSWDCLLGYDELSRSLSKGGCFHRFREAPIEFPPTFRRERGHVLGNAGTYEDKAQVCKSYITNLSNEIVDELEEESVHGRGRDDAPSSETTQDATPPTIVTGETAEMDTPTQALDDEVPSDTSGGGGGGGTEAVRASVTVSGSIKHRRPPSFTDRILLHSLPDCESKVEFLGYNTTDVITVSDHRPVALVCSLEVKDHTSVKGLAQPSPETPVQSPKHDKKISEVNLSKTASLAEKSSLLSTCYVLLSVANLRVVHKFQNTECYLKNISNVLYNTPYYKTAAAVAAASKNKSSKKRTSSKNSKLTGLATEGARELSAVTEEATNQADERGVDASLEGKEEAEHQQIADDDGFGDIMGIELVFPIPSEDSHVGERKVFNAAAEAIPGHNKRASKEVPITFKLPFDDDTQNVSPPSSPIALGNFNTNDVNDGGNMVRFMNSEILNSCARKEFEDFQKNGIQTVSEIEVNLGLHAIVKLVDRDGNLKANGVLNCRDIIMKHLTNPENQSLDSSLTQNPEPEDEEEEIIQLQKRALYEDVEVELTFGGQPRGTVILSVRCERVERLGRAQYD